MLSPVSGEPQYQLKSPGHIAKMQLARAAAAQQAHRRSIAPTPPSSSESKAVQAVSRRRAAAEWVESLTGIALPTASDAALRGALRDGILLCKLLNILRPGILPKVRKQVPSTACQTCREAGSSEADKSQQWFLSGGCFFAQRSYSAR